MIPLAPVAPARPERATVIDAAADHLPEDVAAVAVAG
jgi:hypothetical protein